MSVCRAALAVPGDLGALTGGYLYDRRLLAALRELGLVVRHIALPDSFPAPSPADQAEAARRLADVPPDCPIILDGLAFGAMDRAALSRVRAPIVALIHHPLAEESGLAPARREALYRSERDNLELAAHALVTSAHTATLLTSRYGVPSGRITIARPGADPPSGAAAAIDPPLILAVGILVPRKGHDVLLRALSQLTHRPWQATIVGAARDEQHAKQVRKLAAGPALAHRICIAGCIRPDELALLYRQASVFALATRYEGHGIVFDEAMVHGLPIVTCAVGAVPDTVASGAGLLVPAEDPDAFAEALERVLDDAALRSQLAATSQRAGATLPGWDDTARCTVSVVNQVLAGA